MKLYLYNKQNLEPFMTVSGRVAGVRTILLDEGGVMELPDFIEASSLPDLSERLFEAESVLSPDIDSRVAALEELVASLVYGGDVHAQ